MALTLVNSGDTVYGQVINQVINVLEQPSGGQELGHYKIQGSAYNASAFISCNLITLSRNATPVSLTVDTSDQAPSNMASPSTGHLTQGGAQIFGQATGINVACAAAGKTTMQY